MCLRVQITQTRDEARKKREAGVFIEKMYFTKSQESCGFKKNTKIPPENNITTRESVRHSVKYGTLSEFSLHLHFRNKNNFSRKDS